MQVNRTEHQWLSRLETNRSELAALTHSLQRGSQPAAAGSPEEPAPSNAGRTTPTDRASAEAMLRLLAENLEQVERAVGRLQGGLYGFCEDCSRRIPDERLRFRPEATRCVDCQARIDALRHAT
jgi:RNA polymerase-binding transcription factor DksA